MLSQPEKVSVEMRTEKKSPKWYLLVIGKLCGVRKRLADRTDAVTEARTHTLHLLEQLVVLKCPRMLDKSYFALQAGQPPCELL